MPKSEIWIQEVPVSLQNVLEDGVGLEGVSAPPCSQHYPQSKGPRNTKLTTSLTFLHLLIYLLLFVYVCVQVPQGMCQGQRTTLGVSSYLLPCLKGDSSGFSALNSRLAGP